MELGKKTENYELLKPAQEDFYDVDDFNRNADLIDSALKALADKGISLEEMISSLAQVARTGSYNDLSDKPISLPANGGNADTVDGKHASDFFNIVDNDTFYQTETDINGITETGIYRCAKFYQGASHSGGADGGRNLPDNGDGQGVLEVIRYNGSGYIGTNQMWIHQIYYSPHGTRPWYRFVSGSAVGNWIQLDKNAETLQGYSYDDIMDNAYSDSVDIADMHRTEVIIRSYNTPTNVKGYYYADYVCTSSNAREVIQNAVNNCGAGSTIRLLPGSYDINCFENGNYSTITINKNLTIIGSGMESTVISQTGDSDNGEASSIFTVTDGNVVFKDFRVQDATGEIYNASPVFGSGTVSNVTLENLFFILRNGDGSNSGGIIRAKMSNCRILNCRVFKNADVSSDDYAVGMYSGSQHNIISGILNTGNGYVDISCANQTVADSCVFNGNHRTRRRIGSGDFILI